MLKFIHKKKQGGNSHKDPLQHFNSDNEDRYPKTLRMVEYLNKEPRSYVINFHLIKENATPCDMVTWKNPKAQKFLPKFYISFCLNGKIEDYALSIRMFGPKKEIMFSSDGPISMIQGVTPTFRDKQNNFYSFSFSPKEKIKVVPGAWVCLAQLQKIVKWDNDQIYEAEIIAEKEFEFPIIKEGKQ